MFDKFNSDSETDGGESPPETDDERPCNVSGHDWDEGDITGYYTSGVPHFGRGDTWRVRKQVRRECRKCGTATYEKEAIGKIRIDKDTDEMTVVSNKTRDDQ